MHIKQSRIIDTKFNDPNPSNAVVFGTSGTGPTTKNLARLYDPDKELKRKEYTGRASVLRKSIGAGNPIAFVGKNPEFTMMRANDRWLCNAKDMLVQNYT